MTTQDHAEASVDGARIALSPIGQGVAELLALDEGRGRVRGEWIHTGVYFPVRTSGELQMHGEPRPGTSTSTAT